MIFIQKPAHKLYVVLLLTALLSFPMVNCNNQGSGDSSSDFAVQPGDVTEKDTITDLASYNYNFDSCSSPGNCYHIIYSGSINDTRYVGIAAGTDPKDNFTSFKLFIYFEDTTITGNKDLSDPALNAIVKVIDGGNEYIYTNPSLTLNITGPDGDNCYNIQYNGGSYSVTIGVLTINDDSTALRAGN